MRKDHALEHWDLEQTLVQCMAMDGGLHKPFFFFSAPRPLDLAEALELALGMLVCCVEDWKELERNCEIAPDFMLVSMLLDWAMREGNLKWHNRSDGQSRRSARVIEMGKTSDGEELARW